MPPASVMTWCFEPGLRRSTGLGPVWVALERLDVRAVDHRRRHVELVGRSQLAEQYFVQALPHASIAPVPQPEPASHPDPNPSSWVGTPRGSRCRARTGSRTAPCGHRRLTARELMPPGRTGRQQRCDLGPQLVRHDPRRLLTPTNVQTERSSRPEDTPSILSLGALSPEVCMKGGRKQRARLSELDDGSRQDNHDPEELPRRRTAPVLTPVEEHLRAGMGTVRGWIG